LTRALSESLFGLLDQYQSKKLATGGPLKAFAPNQCDIKIDRHAGNGGQVLQSDAAAMFGSLDMLLAVVADSVVKEMTPINAVEVRIGLGIEGQVMGGAGL
jgi:hypothetical protein